jgi:tRNA(Ile)-lysidine synthase
MRPEGGRVLVACSGGPDSRALLDALATLDLDLYVASVDHGLRPEAAGEAAGVEREARALGLPVAVLRLQLSRAGMASARSARYQALVAHAQSIGAGALAVGHTATDQAETLLDRMLRGTGLRGLGAISPVRACAPGLSLIRPMLTVTAAEVEAYVAARAFAVVRDPTNADLRYRRSRLRHQLLPLLRRERADADRALAELAGRLREDAEALDSLAAQLAGDGPLDVERLRALPQALRARVLLRVCPAPLDSSHVEALGRLCADSHGTRWLSLPGGVVAERAYGRLSFGPPAVDPGDAEVAVDGPGEFALLGLSVAVPAEMLGGGALVLRNLRPGDRVVGGKKLKELLIDRKIPRVERRRLPLLERAGEVIWMYGVLAEKTGRQPVVSALTQRGAVQ